jgi:ribonucleoside-triphosphate reductase
MSSVALSLNPVWNIGEGSEPKQGDEYFHLDPTFLSHYEGRRPNFGFNGLGEFVFYRTYSRLIRETGLKETFLDVLIRVVEGCYEIQRRHCVQLHIPWDREKAQFSAQEMFQRMWDFKFLPPGRGLWMMGTKFMWERGSASLNNCGMVSTDDLNEADPAEPFCFMMDMAMLGVGVGFDTKGAGRIRIRRPNPDKTRVFAIPDSREGWVDSVRQLIRSYTVATADGEVEFDYSIIRPEGSDINGFGGKSSGPGILMELHSLIRVHLSRCIGSTLSSVDITDIMNYIGRCVVAGNVRRTAQIAFGDADDSAYCSMKNAKATLLPEDLPIWERITGQLYAANRSSATLDDFMEGTRNEPFGDKHTLIIKASEDAKLLIPEERLLPAIETWNALNHHRWASNNSIISKVGMEYDWVGTQIGVNGEPGLLWLDNVRDYGRMLDGRQPGIDGRVVGSNPCVEQSLESYELCCLVETFPANHEDADDYMRTLKYAYLYAKTVTLLPTHNRRTNQVMLRNRRIGLSQSGIVQAFAKFGRRRFLKDFCDAGYNEVRRWDHIYADWLCVPKSIKVTSVKPSGTISLVVGATPGIHHPEGSTYWRTVRLAKDSVLARILAEAGYRIEPAVTDPNRTVVAYFGISDERVRPVMDVSIWEQMQNAADLQRYWADNQVSCTIKFKDSERPEIARVLEAFEEDIKGISFLPHENHGFHQAPYIPCSPAEVADYNATLRDVDYSAYLTEAVGSMGCDGDRCSVG